MSVKRCFVKSPFFNHFNVDLPMGGRRGRGGASVGCRPPSNKKKKFEKNVGKHFKLQKDPIVCYARKFHHKRPLCYALNLYLKRPP